MSLNRTYQPAVRCTGAAAPGALAFMAWFLAVYGPMGGRNGGIYACRTIAGTRTLSVHAEGRADDLMIPNGQATVWGWDLAQWLVDNSAELGIQLVIYRRHVWSARYADQGWRPYGGDDPHWDHAHVEFTRDAAATLTVEDINAVAAGPVEVARTEAIVKALPTLKRQPAPAPYDAHVERAQALLRVAEIDLGPDGVDGKFGPDTENAVRTFQEQEELDVDGIIGTEQTWPALLGVL